MSFAEQAAWSLIIAGLFLLVAALCLWAHLSRSAAREDERQRRLAEAIELERLAEERDSRMYEHIPLLLTADLAKALYPCECDQVQVDPPTIRLYITDRLCQGLPEGQGS